MAGIVRGGLDPSVDASATETIASTATFGELENFSALEYFVEITGPSSIAVPVDVVGSDSNSWSSNIPTFSIGPSMVGGYFFDVSALTIDDSDNNITAAWDIYDGSASGDHGIGIDTFDIDQTIVLSADTPYRVSLGTIAMMELPAVVPNGTYSISASVDPTFAIDRAFALDNLAYSIEFSPNLLADTPYTLWLLALSTFGLLVLRRPRTVRVVCGN